MLAKQAVNINFAQGLNTKTDPFQLPIGQFLSLVNSIFTKGGQLQKRNGFINLTSLSNANSFLTTFMGNLTSVGNTLQAYIGSTNQWVDKGSYAPLTLSVQPLLRNNLNQSQADAAIATNGYICTAYTEDGVQKYVIQDSTGQNVVAPTAITSGYGTIVDSPRVFFLGNYFILLFGADASSTYHLQYIAINISTLIATSAANISTSYTPSTTLNFDGVVANNVLYIAWNGASSSGIKMARLFQNLTISSTTNPDSSHQATLMSVTADTTGSSPIIWVSYYNSSGSVGYSLAVDQNQHSILTATQIIPSGTVLNLTSVAQSGILTFFYELSNNYSYDSSIPSHFIKTNTCSQGGTVGSATVAVRSVGLASKAFLFESNPYYLATYQSPYQPTYYLITRGKVVAQVAYENGGGYLTTGLPNTPSYNGSVYIPYLFKDLIQAVNKDTDVASGTQVNGIYSQLGINLASFTIGQLVNTARELGGDLNLPGGFLWMYDGYQAVEQGFFLYPDSVEVAGSMTSGSMTAQQYYYQVTYEWTDNQGNAFRSAPSIPVTVTLTSDTSVTVDVPMLRLTYKTANPVKIVIYRWSAAQQSYYQVTSISSPTLNDPTTDSIAYTDTLADATILGNNLLYTTGGVLEDIGGPATSIMTLFDTRLWLVDSEDPNLLWYSKQVIEKTPVEMSDLLTLYISPTLSSQGSTGPITALAAMDDKLIIFKQNAIYYINGEGPDNTGANSTYSQPTFITSVVGCTNNSSIVFTPGGLMFQSQKGIWLLGRDLSTSYIGAPVEAYNSYTVTSAVNVPNTNQVRFTLNNGICLMSDYYYQQWGTFSNVNATSSTLYEDLHTFLDPYGNIFEESPGAYLDGSVPVLMSFTTSWLNVAGLQGFQRAYWMYLLGTYLSPHTLSIGLAFDYGPITQTTTINPNNFAGVYGSDPTYGYYSPYGGPLSLEQWRVNLSRQLCQSVQLTVQEQFNNAFGTIAGAGLTLSGINAVIGIKKGYRPQPAAVSVG